MVDHPQTDLVSNTQLQSNLVRLLSLTQNEARLYCAMFEGDSFTAAELSHATDIHRSRIYDNLRGLEAKKLVEQTNMDPLRFSVVQPKDAVKIIIESIEAEHRTRIQEVIALGIKLDAIYMNIAKQETATGIRTVALADSISELSRLLETARERVWVSKHTSGGIIDWFVLRTHLNQLIQSDVDVRFLTDRSVRAGYNTRILSKISLSYAVIDSFSITFFISTNAENDGQMMVSSNPDYVGFLEQVFLDDWDKGTIESDTKE
ncbi:MAG: TrmB family transcriptional regulator [Candidatus Thorarchaeota archaeon]